MLFWEGVWGVMGIQFLFIHSFAQSYGNIIMRECFTWFWYIFNYIFKSYSKEGLLKYAQWANSMINIVTKIPDIINFGYWKLFLKIQNSMLSLHELNQYFIGVKASLIKIFCLSFLEIYYYFKILVYNPLWWYWC